MISSIIVNDIEIQVRQKKIKNLHLSVYPNGQVKVSAPLNMNQDTIRLFLITKWAWIKQKQLKFSQQQSPIQHESYYLWGQRYLLKIIEHAAKPRIELNQNQLLLFIRPNTSLVLRQAIIDEWRREQLKLALNKLIIKWQAIIGVQVNQIFVQKMKTRWGSCNYTQGNVRFNLELAKKPPECLEYVVVHELVHLLEPSHNARFYYLMSQFLPHWQLIKTELNRKL
jgi:predicted metal-dependent hydrolase